MNKEELLAQGWDFTFSGPSPVLAWGKYLVHLHNPVSSRRVSGYGEDEIGAIAEAVKVMQQHGELK